MKKNSKEKLISAFLQTGAVLSIIQIILLYLPFVNVRVSTGTGSNAMTENNMLRGFQLLGVSMGDSWIVHESFLNLAYNSLLIPSVILAILAIIFIPKAISQGKSRFNSLALLTAIFSLGYGLVVIQTITFLPEVGSSSLAITRNLAYGAIISFVISILVFVLYLIAYIISYIKPVNYIEDRLLELANLKTKELITEEDYNNQKNNLLGS